MVTLPATTQCGQAKPTYGGNDVRRQISAGETRPAGSFSAAREWETVNEERRRAGTPALAGNLDTIDPSNNTAIRPQAQSYSVQWLV